MFLLASFIFGTIIGSFANVFILRYGTGRSLGGRSSCGSCGKQLVWYELIPVVSYLFQKGKCRGCGSKISPQYLIVELVFGVVFASATYSLLPTANSFGLLTSLHPYILFNLLYLWTVSFLLISLAVYDVKHMIIPDGMLVVLGGVVLVWNIVTNFQLGYILTPLHPSLWMMFVSGPLVALPFFLLWLVSGGRWMGFGDVKLSVVIGWMLGMLGGFSALVFGVWLGALVSLALIGISRLVSAHGGLTMKSEIPFGPFLVAGTLFVLLSHITLFDIVGL